MFKLKKSLPLLLVLILSISTILSGCNKGKEDSTVDQTTGGEEKNEEAVELVWYTIGTPQQDMELVEEELNKYLLEKINATVDVRLIDWGDYTKKMQVKTASGEPFDLVYTCSWANDYATNAAKGAFLPLDDLLESHGQGIKENLHPLFLEGATINGHIYAVPTNKELGWQAMWILNKDLADKYELDLTNISDLDSLEPYLKVIKENEPDVIPTTIDKGSVPYVPLDFLFSTQMPFAIKYDDPTKIVNAYETEEMQHIFNTMHDYYEKGYVHPDAAINSVGDNNKAGKYFAAKAHYQPYAEIGWQIGDFKKATIDIRPVHEPIATNSSTRGAMQAISVTARYPEKAMEFLNLLYTDAYVKNILDFGIEGVHYEKVSDTHIKRTEKGLEAYNFPGFAFGNVFLGYSLEGTPADKWEKFEEFNNACIKAPSLGFTPDLSSVKTEMAAVTNVAEEVAAALYLGTVNPDEFLPQTLQKFEEAGVNIVIEELQKQYDEWLKIQN